MNEFEKKVEKVSSLGFFRPPHGKPEPASITWPIYNPGVGWARLLVILVLRQTHGRQADLSPSRTPGGGVHSARSNSTFME